VFTGRLGMNEKSFREHMLWRAFNQIWGSKLMLFGSKIYPDTAIKLDNGSIVAVKLD